MSQTPEGTLSAKCAFQETVDKNKAKGLLDRDIDSFYHPFEEHGSNATQLDLSILFHLHNVRFSIILKSNYTIQKAVETVEVSIRVELYNGPYGRVLQDGKDRMTWCHYYEKGNIAFAY